MNMNSKPGEQRIKKLITVWRNKAIGEEDPFSKFLFLWICFNAWLAYTSGKDTDRDMINWLVTQDNQSSDLVDCFEKCKMKSSFIDALRAFYSFSPFKDSRRNKNMKIENENDFEGIVRAIYMVRCNLFHGGSEAYEDDIQKRVKISNYILCDWIGVLAATFDV